MRGDHDEGDDEAAAQEFRLLRHKLAELEKRPGRKSRDTTPWSPVLVGQVFDDGAMPTAVPAFFACRPVNVGGVEAEGSAGVFDVMTGAKAYVLVLGSVVPDVGDRLIARAIDGRWVARKDGIEEFPTQPRNDCPCLFVPTTLHLTFSRQIPGLYEDATLVYGPAPAGWESTSDFMYQTGAPFNPTGLMWWSDQVYDHGVDFPPDPDARYFRYGFSCHNEVGTLNIVQSVWILPLGDNTSAYIPLNVGFMHQGASPANPVIIGIGEHHGADPGPSTCSPLLTHTTQTGSTFVTPAPQVFRFAGATPVSEPLVPPVTITLSE